MSKKYSKRRIENNWQKYEESPELEEDNSPKVDLMRILKTGSSTDAPSAYFRHPWETTWDADQASAPSTLSLNFEELGSALSQIPVQERLCVPVELVDPDLISRPRDVLQPVPSVQKAATTALSKPSPVATATRPPPSTSPAPLVTPQTAASPPPKETAAKLHAPASTASTPPVAQKTQPVPPTAQSKPPSLPTVGALPTVPHQPPPKKVSPAVQREQRDMQNLDALLIRSKESQSGGGSNVSGAVGKPVHSEEISEYKDRRRQEAADDGFDDFLASITGKPVVGPSPTSTSPTQAQGSAALSQSSGAAKHKQATEDDLDSWLDEISK